MMRGSEFTVPSNVRSGCEGWYMRGYEVGIETARKIAKTWVDEHGVRADQRYIGNNIAAEIERVLDEGSQSVGARPHKLTFRFAELDMPTISVECPFELEDERRPCAMREGEDRDGDLILECGLKHWLFDAGFETVALDGSLESELDVHLRWNIDGPAIRQES